ncbi:D-glycero-alpha-D-manno-heptose-1,7-bisphosphate 7-phosphatase [Streptomyces sp. NPDC054975]
MTGTHPTTHPSSPHELGMPQPWLVMGGPARKGRPYAGADAVSAGRMAGDEALPRGEFLDGDGVSAGVGFDGDGAGALPVGVRFDGHGTEELPAAVLFDRDGTLVVDVPYNGDPDLVAPVPGARPVLAALRRLGIPVGVVTNQSGVGRGLITPGQAEAVRRRVEELLGPFALWAICPHRPEDGCVCRKPAPGLVLTACAVLGVPPARTVVVGDIGSDMEAARRAGARGVLVPTPVTRPAEIESAPTSAPDLRSALPLILRADGHDAVRPVSPLRLGGER